MRRAVLAAAPLAALLLAGCLNLAAPAPLAVGAGLGGWHLDCSLGALEKARDPAWVQDCVARGSHTPGPKQEIYLAVNPKDPDNVVIGSKDNNPEDSNYCVWNGLAVTHDGGKTWKDVVIGGKYFDRQPGSPYYGFSCNTDPDLAFGPNGDVHYAVEMYDLLGPSASGPLGADPVYHRGIVEPGWLLVLATSHDGGDTWPDAVVEDVGDGAAVVNDYHRTVVNPKTGTILTAIDSISGGPTALTGALYGNCHVDASRDDGKTADLPVTVAGTDPPLHVGCQSLAVAPDGTLVLMGYPGFSASGIGTEQATHVYISWSTDDGRSFTTPAQAFEVHTLPGTFNGSKYRVASGLELAYDLTSGPHRGTLYALYAGNDRGDADEYVRTSMDNGKTWSDPVRVNDDAGNHSQWLGNLAVAGDGSVHAFFLDKRWDPANKLIDVTHAVSLDGGKTWTNERVTNVSWDGDLGRHQERQSFIGDYIGAGAAGNVVWAAFPDASNGVAPVIAAARVVHP